MAVPKLSDRLESEINDFAEGGIILTPAEIIFLAEACNRLDNPFTDVDARLMDVPINVGGSYLWPMTIGASVWLDMYASQWWKGSNDIYFWALVYALLNARNRDAFMTNEHAAFQAVKNVGIFFASTRAELEEAVDRVLDVKSATTQQKTKSKSASIAWSTVVSELEVHSGIMRHEWLWGRSVMSTADSYASLFAIAAALSGSGSSRMQDALDDAINNLARVKKEIRLNHA